MNFEFKCPQCGQQVMADESDRGQVAECPHCGKGIVVPRVKPKLGVTRNAGTGGRTEPSSYLTQTPYIPSSTLKEQVAIPECLACLTQDQLERPRKSRTKGWRRKLLIILLVVLGSIVIIGGISYGGYLYFGDKPRLERGIAHYEKKAYPKAFELLRPLAEKGYAKAQLYIGDCYAKGNGVVMDSEEAVKWYRAAADQELPEAQHRMYTCYHDGIGVERSASNAAKLCRKAADAGFEDAIFDMGMLYVRGDGVEENAKSAFKWFRKGAEHGDPRSLYKFGQCYKLGYGVEKDEDEASKWQKKAVDAWRRMANEGDTFGMLQLAELYMKGDAVELDKEEAVRWYRRAAEMGDAHAQFELADCYYMAKGIEKDAEEAAKWMMKSAEQGTIPISQWVMGRFYQDGTGVEKDIVEAVKWFERAVKKGFAPAKYSLAMCYLRGDGVQQDEAIAEKLLVEAADADDKDAKKELNRIKNERAEQERKLAREKADKERQLAQEKVEKERKIKRLSEIEDEIEERKGRINNILKGTFTGNGNGRLSDWSGFDAGKMVMTDASMSVSEEQPLQRASEKLSDTDDVEKINNALAAAQKEMSRLEERLADIARVKNVYDTKELESRKETCVQCEGKGRVKCARCRGNGTVTSTEREECPTCCDSGRKGQVCSQRRCGKCGGSGQITPRCSACNGKGIVNGSGVDVFGKRRLDGRERCSSCGGSKKGYPISCPGCSGNGAVNVWQTCTTCCGRGFITSGEKETCPVCDGKSDLKCERCDGRGFTYRPKNVGSIKLSN